MDESKSSNQPTEEALNEETSVPLKSREDGLETTLEEQTDGLPRLVVSCLELASIGFSIFSYAFDLGMDIVVMLFHYFGHNHLEFGLTLAFIIIPALTTMFFSLKWYIEDSKNEFNVSRTKWFLRVLFLMLQLGPIMRYISSLSHGIKSKTSKSKRERKFHYDMMVQEDADAALLQLFQAFLEDAPQIILQISILADPDLKHKSIFVQRLTLASSLLGISWTLVAQHRALRLSIPKCAKMSWPGTILQFVWRVFTIAARMLVLGLFASVYPVAFAVLFVSEWMVVTTWIVTMRTTFCQPPSRWQEFVYNAVLGVIFLFCYFNPKDSPTRWRYLIYYTFTFIESTVLISIWYQGCGYCADYKLPVLIAQLCSFWVGITFMMVYYAYLHPTGRIKIWGVTQWDKNEETEMTDTASYREPGCYTISLTLRAHHNDLTSEA